MRRPPVLAFVVGNRLGQLGLYAASFAAIYRFTQLQDGRLCVLSLLCLGLARYAGRARERVGAYRSWKQALGEMTGASPSRPGRRRAFLIALWVILGCWIRVHPSLAGTPKYQSLALVFASLSLWGAASLLLRIFRRARAALKRRPEAPGETIVRVVPSAARSSPSLARITAGLPDYCKRLIVENSAPVLAHADVPPPTIRPGGHP